MGIDEESNGTAIEGRTDDASTAPTDLERKIIRQIEYYFGDHNLIHDKFMKEQIKENEGWIPLTTLVKFNRLAQLSTDFDVIIKSLEKSVTKLLEISEDKQKIRRDPKKPPPEKITDFREQDKDKSVYVKGFPLDSTIDQMLEFFQPYETKNVYMRKVKNKKNMFKGSVFATFDTKEKAEEFFKTEGLRYKDKVLHMEMKVDYAKRKEAEFAQVLQQREERKSKRQTREHGKEEVKEGETKDDDDKGDGFDPEGFDKGCLLKLTGLGDKTSWEDIKKTFTPHSEVAYVDFSRGLTEATVRFLDSDGLKHALEEAKTGDDGQKKLVICEKEIETKVLDGEDETNFWRLLHDKRTKLRQTKKHHSRSNRGKSWGRGGGRGSYRGKGRGRDNRDERKRKNERDNDDTPAFKELKTENKSDVKAKDSEVNIKNDAPKAEKMDS